MVIAAFFGIMFLISHLYSSKVLNVSDEDFNGNELLMEGVGNSFGLFMVSYF